MSLSFSLNVFSSCVAEKTKPTLHSPSTATSTAVRPLSSCSVMASSTSARTCSAFLFIHSLFPISTVYEADCTRAETDKLVYQTSPGFNIAIRITHYTTHIYKNQTLELRRHVPSGCGSIMSGCSSVWVLVSLIWTKTALCWFISLSLSSLLSKFSVLLITHLIPQPGTA